MPVPPPTAGLTLHPPAAPGSGDDLAAELRRIDGKGYRAYKDVEGRWEMSAVQGGYTLCVDWVQVGPGGGLRVLAAHP